ncbi:FG-GAP-like repeat-containing protein [Streptomyces sp. NPDC051183]|uniref:FG-GAP-like repeat-containing protein n=1 Tax=Streptomyces sp. NPDC051183 TaxID=3155165 RepID=UPI00341D26F7
MRLRALVIALLATVLLGGGLGVPASADTVSPKSASALRFLTFNICGGNDEVGTPCGTAAERDAVAPRVKMVKEQVSAWDPDILFLQEICASQFDELEKALEPLGYNGDFTTNIEIADDNTGDLCKSNSEAATGFDKEHARGTAVLSKGLKTVLPEIDLTTGDEKPGTTWRAPCLEALLQGRVTRACSVHLYAFGTKIQTAQAKRLADKAGEWIAAGIPVVLGGDFNPQHWAQRPDKSWFVDLTRTPQAASLDAFYSHSGGAGQFTEVDETDAEQFTPECRNLIPSSGRCRSGAPTVWKSATVSSKYDYIFVSKDHFKNVVGDAPLQHALSDHRPYRGAATWSHCNNAADGKADLLRRGADGSLYRHFGGAAETVIEPQYCKVGAGWNADWRAMRHLARAGDVDGDGTEDLYAIDDTGALRFYPGDRTETFFRWPRALTESESWPNVVNMMTISPDMNGDGRRDMVVRIEDGTLTRISILPGGNVGDSADIPAPGGEKWSDYNKIVTPGDITGDGVPDLLARTPAGDLYLYETGPDDTFKPRVRIGWGWNVYDGFAAPGDVDGDGRPDLLARDTKGVLWFYAGLGSLNGTIAFVDRIRSGSGYSTGETLF